MQSLAMQKREMAERARDELKFCYDGLGLPSTASFEEAEAVCRQNLQNWHASKFDGSSRRSNIAEQKRQRFEDILQRLEIAREAQSSLTDVLKLNSQRARQAEIESQKEDLISEAPADNLVPQDKSSKKESEADHSALESTSELGVESGMGSAEAEEPNIRHNRFRSRLAERRERYQQSQLPTAEIPTLSEAEQVEIAEPGAEGIELNISESESESEAVSVIENEQDSEISGDNSTDQSSSSVGSEIEISALDGDQAESSLITEGGAPESLVFESSSNAILDDQEDNDDGPIFSSENETQKGSLFERAILNLHSQQVQIDQSEAVEPSENPNEHAFQKEPEIFEFFHKQEEIPSELGDIFDSQSEDPSEDTTSVFADFTESPSVLEEPYSENVAKTPSLDPALFGGFEMEYAPPAAQAGEANEEGIPVAEFDDLPEADGFTWSEESQQITDAEDQVFEADALALTEPQEAHTEVQETEWEATSLDSHQEQLDSAEGEIAWESPEAFQQEQNIEGDEVAPAGDYPHPQSEDQWTEDDYLASEDEDQNWIEENPEAAGEVYYEDELDPDALQAQAQDTEAVVQQGEYAEFQDNEEVAYEDEDEDEYTEEDQYDSYSEEEDFDDPSADDLSEEQELENEDDYDPRSSEATFARGNHQAAAAALNSDEDFEDDTDFDDDDLEDEDLEGVLGRPKRHQSRIVTLVGVFMIFLILGGAVAGYFYFSNKNPDIESLMAEEGAAGGSSLNSNASSESNDSIFSSNASSSNQTNPLRDTPGSVAVATTTPATAATNGTAITKNSSSNESPQMSANEAFSLGQELEMSGSPADMAKALDAYLIAGEQGMASAQLRLGIFYFEGLAGEPDYTKAAEWYLKAAERGRPEAQFYLACMTLQNIGPKNELNNPAHWLREASDQQYSNAQVNLALLYLDGAGSIARDPNIAAMLLRQAAEQGNPLGQALLGMLYDRGESVEEDPVQAENWYRKAVERDPLENPMDVPGLPPVTRQTSWEILRHAQKVLAAKILETTGVNSPSQIEEAKKLLESAAETNDPQAQFNLGLLYCDSSLSETDYPQARKWFQEAASSNYPPAWVNLGWMYENGYGVEKDIKKAEENYIHAVNSGDALAQYRLGLLYLYEGDKSSGDEIKAYHWIKTAASNGVPEAATKLNEWEQELKAKGANLSTSAVEAWRILDSLTELEIQSDPNSQSLELENNNSSLSGFSIVSVFKLL